VQATRAASGSETPAKNVREYLEDLAAGGVWEEGFRIVRPLFHKRIFDRLGDREGPDGVDAVIDELRREDAALHVEGGSWTSDISWVRGYDRVPGPMESRSAAFAAAVRDGLTPAGPRYAATLYYLLLSQTSCFRYWGEAT
jgi:hypothetical protein